MSPTFRRSFFVTKPVSVFYLKLRGQGLFADTRFQRLMETEAVGIIFFNNEGTVVDANDVFLKMVDYTREDLASGTMSWRKLTPPEWIATSEQQMVRVREDGPRGPV